MAPKACTVVVYDLNDTAHQLDVTAETLYQAVAQALAMVRGHDRVAPVSAELKGSQFSRFRGEPESLPVVAEHTNAAAAVEDKQSRLRVVSPPND